VPLSSEPILFRLCNVCEVDVYTIKLGQKKYIDILYRKDCDRNNGDRKRWKVQAISAQAFLQ